MAPPPVEDDAFAVYWLIALGLLWLSYRCGAPFRIAGLEVALVDVPMVILPPYGMLNVVALLNECHATMVEKIFELGGTLDQVKGRAQPVDCGVPSANVAALRDSA